MKYQAFPLKKVLTVSFTAAVLAVPLTFMAGSAQASEGSYTVRGEPNERTTDLTGEQPQVVDPHALALTQPGTASLSDSAQTSRGSYTVRGEPNERTRDLTGEQLRVVYPPSQAVTQPDSESLSLSERAINPVLNPDKPLNSGSHH